MPHSKLLSPERRHSGEHPHNEKFLRDHFLSTLLDPVLCKFLGQSVRQTSTLTFNQVRMSAIEWDEGSEGPSSVPVAAIGASTHHSPPAPVASPTSPELKDTVQMMHEIMSMMKDMFFKLRGVSGESSVSSEIWNLHVDRFTKWSPETTST